MLTKFTALYQNRPNPLQWPDTDLCLLPAKMSKRSTRGCKQVYQDGGIIVMALVHVAWQMSYEEVVDYFRTHPQAAQAAGFPPGQVIGVSQYWERRRALGIGPFWFFFVAIVWQLLRLGVIKGTEVILDGTTLRIWFHKDPEAGWWFRLAATFLTCRIWTLMAKMLR